MTDGRPRPLHEYLLQSAGRCPEKEVLVQGTRRVTYGALRRDVEALASFLLRNDANFSGKRTCLILDNSPEYVTSYFAVLKAGGVVVPVGERIVSRGTRKILEDCTPSVVILRGSVYASMPGLLDDLPFIRTVILTDCDLDDATSAAGGAACGIAGDCQIHALRAILKAGTDGAGADTAVSPDSLAMIIYTSGTTGNPKGVMLSHRNLASNAISIIQYLGLSAADSVMVVLPFYYSYGTSLLNTHIIVGGSLVLENSFLYPNVVLKRMVEERVTGFSGVPSTFAILLKRSNLRKYELPDLRYLTQAGGAMSPTHTAELLKALPGKKLFIMYGQTEASARLSYLDPGEVSRKVGSIGKAIPGVKLTVRKPDGAIAAPGDEGEIVAEGPNIMLGYWGLQEESRKVLRDDGLHTGDLAKADEEGYLYIIGRRSDVIKCGAHRIGAKEIEEILLEIPAVCEAAVVGENDDILGESIKACVVLAPGARCGKMDILAYCKANLPAHKIPKTIEFHREFPKTESGKVRKHMLASPGRNA